MHIYIQYSNSDMVKVHAGCRNSSKLYGITVIIQQLSGMLYLSGRMKVDYVTTVYEKLYTSQNVASFTVHYNICTMI